MFPCHHATPNDHRCAGTDLASAERHPRSSVSSGLEPEQGVPRRHQVPKRAPTHVRERLQPAGPLLCFCLFFFSHYSPVPCPVCQCPHPPGRKEAPTTQGRRHEGGGVCLGGPGPRTKTALTEVQELLHGEWRRREARIEVHLARNAELRRRPRARGRGRGQAPAGAGDGAERPDARAAPQQPCQPHTEPRRRSRSSRRQPATLCRCPGATCGTWRAAGRGRGAAVSAAATAPSLEPRPRGRSPDCTEAGERQR